MSQPVKFIVSFLLIMAVQLFVLDDMVIKSSITLFHIPAFIPMIYPIILLLLPLSTPNWLSMLLGFITGMLVDTFNNTPGLHAAAGVMLGFIRPNLLNLFFQQNVKDLGYTRPTLFRMGFTSFVLYTSMAISIHHFFYFFIQEWSLPNFFIVLFKTLLSSVISVLLVLISQLIFSNHETKRT
jgi:rod shape-determining protein MreD